MKRRDVRIDGRLRAVVAKGFRHKMRIVLRGDDQGKEYKSLLLDIRIMTAAAWKKLKARDEAFKDGKRVGRYEWSAAELEGGMFLAIRGADRHSRTQSEDEPFPERTVEVRKLRGLLLDMLDANRDQFGHVNCVIGAEGGCEFQVDLDADNPHPAEARITLAASEEM